ncbi:MAG: ABC transporter permease [Lentimicrobium sp.]|nr:ABC transporter permease [Lentimicrobium sp.]MDD2526480.1 ABC transporter permease [Lentimicrobiaceae bacterium]MDD4596386.1 ABC transporter permease [Lentimicrobiaceae bacterium]MDY0025902.1 ABC transporter permease [Lentimicrobium sp.]
MFFKRKPFYEGSLSAKAFHRLLKNKPALISMCFIGLLILVAILGYLITPDQTPFANQQQLEIAAKKPGFRVSLLKVTNNEPGVECNIFKKIIFGCPNQARFIPMNSWYFSGDSIVVEGYEESPEAEPLMYRYELKDVIYALPREDSKPLKDLNGTKIVYDTSMLQQKVGEQFIVTRTFLLGTDRFGRDVLSQLMIGARVSLSVGLISVFISLVVGISLGALAGYFRGRVDDFIIWLINVVWSVPTILLVIAITFALGKGFWQVFVAVGLTMWVEVARVVRGQFMSIREKEYVEAARALGFGNLRMIFRHILPNTLGPVIVISAANFASAILIEAGLSFLGIGVQPPMPSWGTMVKENYAYIILDNPWLALLPGIAIMLLVLAFMLLGNALRDALDVKTTLQV